MALLKNYYLFILPSIYKIPVVLIPIAQLIAQGDLLLATHLIGNENWAEIDESGDIREAETIVARWVNQEFSLPARSKYSSNSSGTIS